MRELIAANWARTNNLSHNTPTPLPMCYRYEYIYIYIDLRMRYHSYYYIIIYVKFNARKLDGHFRSMIECINEPYKVCILDWFIKLDTNSCLNSPKGKYVLN